MNKEKTRLCPFKKQIKKTFRRGKHGEPDMIVSDRLGYCAGERCMAYKDGRCLRIEKIEDIPLKVRKRK